MMDGRQMEEDQVQDPESDWEESSRYWKSHPDEFIEILKGIAQQSDPLVEIYGPRVPDSNSFIFAMTKEGQIPTREQFEKIIEGWKRFYEYFDDRFIYLYNCKVAIECGLEEYLQKKGYESDLDPTSDSRNPGFIYIIRSIYGYKIGRTKHYSARMKLFSVKLPFEFDVVQVLKVSDMWAAETVLHMFFTLQEKHINGEWFSLSEADLVILQFLDMSHVFQYGAFGNEAE